VPVPKDLPLSLGADVPVCCEAPRPTRMRGIGEVLSPAPALPPFWLVLVNPLLAVPTGGVFAAVRDRNPPPGPEAPRAGFPSFEAFAGWLACQRNDLQHPAVELCPRVGEVLAALSDAPLARMSGSGATCFALVEDQARAAALAARLRPTGWWVVAAPVASETSGRPIDDEARNILERDA
jgi:4-diphosphocytidyl-2-C-methyl-D-erythritol kinase